MQKMVMHWNLQFISYVPMCVSFSALIQATGTVDPKLFAPSTSSLVAAAAADAAWTSFSLSPQHVVGSHSLHIFAIWLKLSNANNKRIRLSLTPLPNSVFCLLIATFSGHMRISYINTGNLWAKYGKLCFTFVFSYLNLNIKFQ